MNRAISVLLDLIAAANLRTSGFFRAVSADTDAPPPDLQSGSFGARGEES